jgi:S-adenosyl-L-methionine hydrolase (adenosine-forming)
VAGKPVIALLTDFGIRDHYVGTMKGVVLSVCPDASLVDVTHDIPPQDIFAAALELDASYRYFPPATVFLVVIDPGVGSTRRAIAAEIDGYRFVAPDNGVLSPVLRASASPIVVELLERRFARSTISRTFEGRDRFAPAAGWLARGTKLQSFGPALSDYVTLDFPIAEVTATAIRGQVVRVDRFGNLITNIKVAALDRLTRASTVTVNKAHTARIVLTYASVAPGELCAVVGSSGHLEVAINAGNAAARLDATRGARVVVTSE